MIRRPPRSTRVRSSAASDVYKRQGRSKGDCEAGREEGGGELTGEGGSSAMHRCFSLRGPWPDPAPSPAAGGPHGRGDDPGSVPHASTVGASRLAAGAPARRTRGASDLRLRVSAGLRPASPGCGPCSERHPVGDRITVPPRADVAGDLPGGRAMGEGADRTRRPGGHVRVYTRTGDDGTTGTFLGGRVSKADALIDACGDIDEAVSSLGVARASCRDAALASEIFERQRELFVVAADLATNPRHRDRLEAGISLVTKEMVDAIEQAIDGRVAVRPLRPVFVVPGTGGTSAALDNARTVVRRAERRVVALQDAGQGVSPEPVSYTHLRA